MAEDVTNVNPIVQGNENKLVNKALSKFPIPNVTGMQLAADISIGSLTLNTIDANGVIWVCTDIEGWWTTPDPELPDLPRGWGDGSYDARGRYAARALSLNGAFLTQDPSQVAAARKTLIEAIDLVYDGGDLVVNETPSKTSFVRLSGRPQISTVNARGRTEFSVGLKASDPIKYEYLPTPSVGLIEDGYRIKTIATTVATVFSNAGNTKTPVIIELTGAVPVGATISNAINYIDTNKDDVTETITLVKAVPSGSTLEIDTLNREALLVTAGVAENGRSYISTLSSWFYILPDAKAENKLTFTSATGTCKVFYRSGWIG